MLTRKDYKAIAGIVKRQSTCFVDEEDLILIKATKDVGRCYASDLANYFATNNSYFNRDKFFKACGLGD